jgi:hypothetical protein
MTTLFPIGTPGPIASSPVSTSPNSRANATAQPAATSPSTSVTLGQSNSAANAQTYSFPLGQPAQATFPVAKTPSSDAVTSLMTINFFSPSLAGQFQGLGAAALTRFTTEGSDFSQLLQNPASQSQGQNQMTLDIRTAGGAKVELSLSSQGNGLEVDIKVTDGSLSEADRSALAKLSGAFQNAIDGLTTVPPQLDLSGLTQFDPSVLSSVDFHANVQVEGNKNQTVDFHADSQRRTLSSAGPSGTVKVGVDMSNPAIFGSPAQQAQAIDRYTQQFDAAQSRGKGDASLMAMFKDAFTELNSNYGTTASKQAVGQAGSITLGDADHSMLTGLADFTASISQTASAPNPMRPDEPDTFSYQVSQNTRISGNDQLNFALMQQQQSHLSANYHQAIPGGGPLALTKSIASQNYDYYQIDDDARSLTDIAYSNGALVKASTSRSDSQSTQVSEYLRGEMVKNTTTPTQASQSSDLTKLLNSARLNDRSNTPQARADWEQTLSSINNRIYLQADPSQLHD